MTMINPLVSLAEAKQFMSVRNETASTDALDDGMIELLIQGVSEYFNNECHRTFYPRYEIRWQNVPILQNSPRVLFLDDDLLEEVKITNGDGNAISNSPTMTYYTKPLNMWPKYAIAIAGPASIFWIFNVTTDATHLAGSVEHVIQVEGWWGYRKYYTQRGWSSVGTLGAAVTDTTGLTLTMTTGHTLAINRIVKIDTEIFNVSNVSTNTVTVLQRGDNGSTAATHLNGATVYGWNVEPDIRMAVLQTVQNMYSTHSGQSSGGRVSVTAAGVVIRPEDIPDNAQKTLIAYTRPL